jgi:RsiW-degrading membrane proteinase PrsW (M82 family)
MILAAVVACALVLALVVYRYDLYEKEPWYLLVAATALGYFTMGVVGRLEDLTHFFFETDPDNLAGHALVAATHEEAAKLLLVAALAFAFRRHFNDPMDGLIYGAMVGLGMALEESVFYMSLTPELGPTVIASEAVRLLLHLLMGGLSGFAVGLATTRMRRWPAALAVWLAAAMGLHFLWDYWVGLPLLNHAEPPVDLRTAAIVLMGLALLGFGLTVMLASRWSCEKFSPGQCRPLWGWPFRG